MTTALVSDLTVDELKGLIRETVTQTMMELLRDPDIGLELQESFVQELTQAQKNIEAGQATTSAEEVAQRLGLEW